MSAGMTETETKWSERVKEWKASGRTAKEFAQGRDFKPATLTYWSCRLRQIAGRGVSPTSREESARGPATPQVRMVRVRRTRVGRERPTEQAAVGRNPTVTIAIGAARIEVGSGFDPALLSDVVAALGGAR